jgi:hypothetical protein
MTPSAATLALVLPGGMAQAMGLRSLGQLAEPGPDPESTARLLGELLDVESDNPSHGRTEAEPC